jgi:hypothetical protein
MSKAQPYWASFKQPPRSMKSHGKHRRTDTSSHRRPAVRASDSAGGTLTFDPGTAVWTSWQSYTVIGTDLAGEEPKPPAPPAVPYAGIRTGEIIGHRLWWVMPGPALCSLAHDRVWQPGETLTGNLDELVDSNIFGTWYVWGGVYAFSDTRELPAEIKAHVNHLKETERMRDRWGMMTFSSHWSATHQAIGFVSGTVKMWGDVIEHAKGFRSQFAKVNSIDEIHHGSADWLLQLRARYGV